MNYLAPGVLCLLAMPWIAQATTVDDVGCFIQRNVDKTQGSEELSAVAKLQAGVEAVEKATGSLRAVLKQQIMADHPQRRLQVTKAMKKQKKQRRARSPAGRRSRRSRRQGNLTAHSANGTGAEVVHEAMQLVAELRGMAGHNGTTKGRVKWCKKDGNVHIAGGFTFFLDAVMMAVAFVPEYRCLFLLIGVWYVMGLLTLHCDQGLSVPESMLVLAQLATTVGYGTSTPTSNLMRIFHGVHGVLVGQGIDDAMSSIWDYPMDWFDNCLWKRGFRGREMSVRKKLGVDLVAKTLDLGVWIIGTSAYFFQDFAKSWKGDDGDEQFDEFAPFKGANFTRVFTASIYTALISMTSIGYGDLFPKGQGSKVASPFVLHPLVNAFKRYSSALATWNTLDKQRNNVEPPSAPEPWNVFTCPAWGTVFGAKSLPGGTERPRYPNLLPESWNRKMRCEEEEEEPEVDDGNDVDDGNEENDDRHDIVDLDDLNIFANRRNHRGRHDINDIVDLDDLNLDFGRHNSLHDSVDLDDMLDPFPERHGRLNSMDMDDLLHLFPPHRHGSRDSVGRDDLIENDDISWPLRNRDVNYVDESD